MRWTGWPVGHVYFADPADPARAVPSPLWYLSDPARFAAFKDETERLVLPRGVGLPGRVLQSGRAEWIVDVTCSPNFPRSACAAGVGLRGGFSFPVGTADETIAVIECFSLQAVTPDDRLLEVASHVGRQLGRLIAGLRTEMALRESESRFRSVAEAANDAIIAADREGLILSWNPAAERMFGYSAERMLGKPLSLLMPERFRPMHDAGVQRVAAAPGGFAHHRPDGRGRRAALRRSGVPDRALALHVGGGRHALLRRHHPGHRGAQAGRGPGAGAGDRSGPDRPRRRGAPDRARQRAHRAAVRL